MSNFSYSAAKQNGEIVKGERESENEKTLALALKNEGLLLLRTQASAGSGLAKFNVKIDLNEVMARLRPISMVEKMFFTRNLAVMIAAGLPLTRAMDALSQESSNPRFKNMLAEINSSVMKGKTLADSLKIHEKVFGTLFINMVEVGETTGKLTLVLKLLARQMKKDYDLRKRVKGAMMYPAIIISALVIVGTLMMVYVVPTLTQTIKDLGAELPPTTKIIIFISDLLSNYIIFVATGFVAFALAVWRLLKTQKGKELFDRFILKAPLFGSLVKKFNVARFTRTLSYLITSGIPVVRSLDITSKVLGNTLYKRAAEEASRDIQKGKQLNEILGVHTEIFQPVVIQMIKVGEETGKVSDLLLRIALFFEEDVNETTKNLSTIIEPLLMIFIGVAVGFFAISMLQPIYGSLGSI